MADVLAPVSSGQLARILGLTPRRVNQLAEAGVFPRLPRGKYDLAQCVQAYIATVSNPRDGVDLAEAKRRKTAAEAELLELRLATERRELVTVDAVADIVAREYSTVRSRLLAMPSKLAVIVAAEDGLAVCHGLIAAEVREALSELSDEAAVDEALAPAPAARKLPVAPPAS